MLPNNLLMNVTLLLLYLVRLPLKSKEPHGELLMVLEFLNARIFGVYISVLIDSTLKICAISLRTVHHLFFRHSGANWCNLPLIIQFWYFINQSALGFIIEMNL